MASLPPPQQTSRLAQEREFYKYNPHFNSGQDGRISSVARSSPDTALTAFAQLATLRLNTQRAIISLFDRTQQHVLAEATRTLSLQDDNDHEGSDALWVGCCVIPKETGFCKHVSKLPLKETSSRDDKVVDGIALVVPDLTKDDRFKDAKMVREYPHARFYAAVPIVSPKGITIGSYCILDDKIRPGLKPSELKFMTDMSATVMSHLEMTRSKFQHRRAERMIVGLGSFVEGKSTLRNSWVRRSRRPTMSDQSDDSSEGRPNVQQQEAQELSQARVQSSTPRPSINPLQPSDSLSSDLPDGEKTVSSEEKPASSITVSVKSQPSTDSIQQDVVSLQIKEIFSRAANIVRESIEVEGVIFLDASVGSYGGLVSEKGPGADSSFSETPSASEDERSTGRSTPSTASAGKDAGTDHTAICEILGFSTSTTSSIDNGVKSEGSVAVSESFLKNLLRRYPQGKIFNFDEGGSVSSDESSDDPLRIAMRRHIAKNGVLEENGMRPKPRRIRGKVIRCDADSLIHFFPGARSIAFSPMWDSHRRRWFSGCLAWTNTPQRVFTAEDELTYLSAFGDCTMAEAHRIDAETADRAKSNLVSSISHELRSPLHGIFGTAEILNDTALNALQHGMVHTIESCALTLLDTINHLLDFAEINKFKKDHKSKSRRSLLNRDTPPTPKDPTKRRTRGNMVSLTSNLQLDEVLEEVVESVFAGFSFYNRPQPAAPQHRSSVSSEESASSLPEPLTSEPVKVFFEVDPAAEWKFYTQAGAWRRILMNIFGNALKYTKTGYVHVRLTVAPFDAAKTANHTAHRRVLSEITDSQVVLSVKDTGQGIGAEFLKNALFTPFAQENSLSPGNGLGLSIARQAVLSLNGYIEVSSCVGKGTEVTIGVPLTKSRISGMPPHSSSESTLLSMKNAVHGKSIGLLGFAGSAEEDPILRGSLETLCQGWFGLNVHVLNNEADDPRCDFYIAMHADISSASSRKAGQFPSPTIVICPSPDAAHDTFLSSKNAGQAGIVEFVSQPCGPRKLAKALDMIIKQQDGIMPRAATLPGVPSDEDDSSPGFDVQKSSTIPPLLSRRPTTRRLKTMKQLNIDKADLSTNSAQAEGQEESQNISLPHRPVQTTENARSSILLVEDNDINLKLLVAYVRKGSHDYETARNGSEAFEAYRTNPTKFGVILMDISMPIMDGLEATRKIRGFEKNYHNTLEPADKVSWKPATIVALTGLASGSAQREAFASGMDLFLTKPVKMQDLKPILERMDIM